MNSVIIDQDITLYHGDCKRSFTKTHRQRISQSLKRGGYFQCLICNRSFWRKPEDIKNGDNKFCCKEHYFIWQIGKKKIIKNQWNRNGKNNPNWRGGIQGENSKIRASEEYKDWRHKVFERDDWTCCKCGSRGYLHAHHIKPFSLFPELRFVIDNGVTLCNICHSKEPKGREILCLNITKMA